jgi:hypothetical protein
MVRSRRLRKPHPIHVPFARRAVIAAAGRFANEVGVCAELAEIESQRWPEIRPENAVDDRPRIVLGDDRVI